MNVATALKLQGKQVLYISNKNTPPRVRILEKVFSPMKKIKGEFVGFAQCTSPLPSSKSKGYKINIGKLIPMVGPRSLPAVEKYESPSVKYRVALLVFFVITNICFFYFDTWRAYLGFTLSLICIISLYKSK